MAPPRINPGTSAQIGPVNNAITRVIGLGTGGKPPHVMTTLARHRGLFRKWLRFAGALMPGGILPRADTELLILRVAHLAGSEYEWHHHERIGRLSGLSAEEIARVRSGPDSEGWTERQRLLLRAADELLAERTIGDELWGELAGMLSEDELIELCMLVGHYAMLAMTLNALRVEPDPPPSGGRGPVARIVEAAAARRMGGSAR